MTVSLLMRLEAESRLLDEFLDLMSQEAQALSEHDFVTLSGLVKRKADLAEGIAQADRAREALLLQMGHGADRAGADAAAATGGPAVQAAWARLLRLATLAREQNHRNGVLVHAHLDFTRESIGVLQTGQRPLYGPGGVHRAAARASLRAVG